MPDFASARVQIDIDAHMIGMRYPYEVNLVGDARATLRRLIPLLNPDRGGREVVRHGVREREALARETMERRAGLSADPINPRGTWPGRWTRC